MVKISDTACSVDRAPKTAIEIDATNKYRGNNGAFASLTYVHDELSSDISGDTS